MRDSIMQDVVYPRHIVSRIHVRVCPCLHLGNEYSEECLQQLFNSAEYFTHVNHGFTG